MTSLLARGRGLARSVLFAAHGTGVLASFELRHRGLPPDRKAALLARHVDHATRFWQRLFGIELTLVGTLPSTPGGALIVSNHHSTIDIPVLLSLFGGVLVSRHDVETWPLLGPLARHARTIFVNREDPGSGARAIRTIRERLRQGEKVTAFPEGTTHTGNIVQPFHAGVFAAARGLDVAIVPVGLVYLDDADFIDRSFVGHLLEIASRPRTRIVVTIGAAERSEKNTSAAAEYFRARVQALVDEALAGTREKNIASRVAPPPR